MNQVRFSFLSIRAIKAIIVLAVCIVIGSVWYTTTPPHNFPVGSTFTVNEGESMYAVSLRLQKNGIIRSALFFRATMSFLEKDRTLALGVYVFDHPYTMMDVVMKFASGVFDQPLLSITIPEGSSTHTIVTIVHKALPLLTPEELKQAIMERKVEGMLFPSTYYIVPSMGVDDIITMMTKAFTAHTKTLLTPPWPDNLTSEHDVIVLASIIQGEAKDEVDMKRIAGILLSRLAAEMPLQVDVAKETYTKRGLPAIPINSPGLVAMSAVLNPTPSPFLFYLTGKDGTMHYAKTFTEHKANITKYLR